MRRLWLWRCKEFEFITDANGQRQGRHVRTFYFLGASAGKALSKLGTRSKAHLGETGDRFAYDIQKLTAGALWRSRQAVPPRENK